MSAISPGLSRSSVTHSLPSEPLAIPAGPDPVCEQALVAIDTSETAPAVVIRPTSLVPGCTNHRAPSGPTVIACGRELGVALSAYSVIAPEGVIRPIALAFVSLNQRLPSGPDTIPVGLAAA